MSKIIQLLLTVSCLFLGPALFAQAGSKTPEWELQTQAQAPSFHLGSYSSRMAGKLDRDGTIDTGFIKARMIRGPGDPIVDPFVDHPVSRLWALAGSLENDIGLGLSMMGVTVRSGTDERLVVPCQFRLENISDEPRSLSFGIEISAGGGVGLDRPWGAVDFPGKATFSQEDDRILRDGRVVMTWGRNAPHELVITGDVASPTETAAVALWELELPPGAVRLVEFKLVGPPVLAPADETPFRERLDRQPFAILRESLDWETGDWGSLNGFFPASDELRWMVLGSIMMLRAYGVAEDTIEFLTDRPFGHEPTDAAVPAEILAVLFEWGLADRGVDMLDQLVDRASTTCQKLSPERRVAFLHALTRCMRLAGGPHGRASEVSDLILEFVDQPVTVAVWNDPETVRLDFLELLADAGRPEPEGFPTFRWAGEVAPETASAKFMEHRRALAAGDSAAAWTQVEELYPFYSIGGQGSDVPNGMPDGRHALGTLSVVRETLIDDHGGRLEIFPGIDLGFIELRVRYPGVFLPTRFGSIKAETYFAGRGIAGGRMAWYKSREPEQTLFHVVESATGTRMNFVEGGRARVYDEDTVELKEFIPGPFGFRFSLAIERAGGTD